MILTSNYKFSEAREIDNTFIIRLQGNDESKRLADRCAYSCYSKEQRYTFWDAFDGTKDNVVRVPVARRADWINWIKIPNNKYSPSQVACFFSHVSLWAHCAEIDKPIVILEHLRDYYLLVEFLGFRPKPLFSGPFPAHKWNLGDILYFGGPVLQNHRQIGVGKKVKSI